MLICIHPWAKGFLSVWGWRSVVSLRKLFLSWQIMARAVTWRGFSNQLKCLLLQCMWNCDQKGSLIWRKESGSLLVGPWMCPVAGATNTIFSTLWGLFFVHACGRIWRCIHKRHIFNFPDWLLKTCCLRRKQKERGSAMALSQVKSYSWLIVVSVLPNCLWLAVLHWLWIVPAWCLFVDTQPGSFSVPLISS